MTWRPNNPNNTNEILAIPGFLEGNFTVIDQACILEHQPLSGTSASGEHIPGVVGVVRRDTTASISLLSSPATGALVWDTNLGILKYFSGTTWVGTSSNKWSRVRAYMATANTTLASGTAPVNIGFNGISYDTLSEFVTGAAAAFTTPQVGFYLITSTVSVQGSGTQDISGIGNPNSDVLSGWATTPAATAHYFTVDSYPATADTFYVTASTSGTVDLYLTGATVLSGFQYRLPTGNNSIEWVALPPQTSWYNVSKYPVYADSSYNYITPTAVIKEDSFTYPVFSLPASSNNIVLTLSIRGTAVYSPTAMHVSGAINVGGTTYTTPELVFPAYLSWGTRTYSWALNPMTSLAWTEDEINSIGPTSLQTFGYLGTSSTAYADISEIHLEVTYSYPLGTALVIPAGSTEISIKAHYRLRTSGTAGAVIQPSIAEGATIHYGPNITPTSAFLDTTYSWDNDPATGLPWTVTAAMSVTGVGLKVYSVPSSGGSADCSQAYLSFHWFPTRPVLTALIVKNAASSSTSAILAQTFKPVHESGFNSGQTAKVSTIANLASGDTINIKCAKTLMGDDIVGDLLGQNTFVCIHRLSGIGGL